MQVAIVIIGALTLASMVIATARMVFATLYTENSDNDAILLFAGLLFSIALFILALAK